MIPGFQIGPVTWYWYGLILSAAVLTSFLTAKLLARGKNLPQEKIEELAVILIIPVIFGARIYHVLDFWEFYSANLSQIFFIWQGGIGIIGAQLAGLLTIFFYSKWRKLPFFKLADLAALSLALGQAIGRLANFVNSEGFGPPTNLPWAVYIDPAKRPENFANFSLFHPTFFYEAIGDLLIFLILIAIPAKLTGARFGFYLILYSLLRFGLEFLRIDSWQIGIIKVAQVISLIGLMIGFTILVKILAVNLKWMPKLLA